MDREVECWSPSFCPGVCPAAGCDGGLVGWCSGVRGLGLAARWLIACVELSVFCMRIRMCLRVCMASHA